MKEKREVEKGIRRRPGKEGKTIKKYACDRVAKTTPIPKGDAYLTQIGLGLKKMTFSSSMNAEEVHYDFYR